MEVKEYIDLLFLGTYHFLKIDRKVLVCFSFFTRKVEESSVCSQVAVVLSV